MMNDSMEEEQDLNKELAEKKVEELRAELEGKKSEVEKLMTELSGVKNKLLRERANVENLQRDHMRDLASTRKSVVLYCMKQILPTVHDFEIALENTSDHDAFLNGVKIVNSSLIDALGNIGLEVLDPIGKTLNSNEHSVQKTDPHSTEPANTVIQVLRKGYKIGDQVIEPASVVVSVKSDEQENKHR